MGLRHCRRRGDPLASLCSDERASESDAAVTPLAPATDARLPVDGDTAEADVIAAVRTWVDEHVPPAWRDAGERGGPAAIRAVRSARRLRGVVPGVRPLGHGRPRPTGGVRRPRRHEPHRSTDRDRAAAVQPRAPQRARPQPRGADPARVRHRGAEAPLPPADRAQRGGLVPALLRTRRRFRPGLARVQGRARR